MSNAPCVMCHIDRMASHTGASLGSQLGRRRRLREAGCLPPEEFRKEGAEQDRTTAEMHRSTPKVRGGLMAYADSLTPLTISSPSLCGSRPPGCRGQAGRRRGAHRPRAGPQTRLAPPPAADRARDEVRGRAVCFGRRAVLLGGLRPPDQVRVGRGGGGGTVSGLSVCGEAKRGTEIESSEIYLTFPRGARLLLARGAQLATFEEGEQVCRAGDPMSCVYVVLHGSLELRGGGGKEGGATGRRFSVLCWSLSGPLSVPPRSVSRMPLGFKGLDGASASMVTEGQSLGSLSCPPAFDPMTPRTRQALRLPERAEVPRWARSVVAAAATECAVVTQQQWAHVMEAEAHWDARKVRCGGGWGMGADPLPLLSLTSPTHLLFAPCLLRSVPFSRTCRCSAR